MKYRNAYPGISSSPSNVDISITGKCNLKCRYCFYNESMEKADDLPTNKWLLIFKELGSIGVRKLCLSGGEPFLRKDFFQLVDCLIENRMRYSVLTNGTLIDEKTVAEFTKGKRRLRLDSIQVSIDGSNAEIHDRSRPPKSFDRAINALKLLIRQNFPVNVRVTINRHNINDLENIASLLIDDLGLGNFSTNEAEYQGSARCEGQDIILSAGERKKAMASLITINEKFGGRVGAQSGPLARAKTMAEITRRISRGETGMKGRGTLCSCGGVFSKMAILHDGTFVPCNMLPELVMGSFGETSIEEAWQTHPNINAIRERRKISLNTLAECHGCKYTDFCTGGCPGTVLAKTGKLNSIDPLSCYRKYLEEEKQQSYLQFP